MKKERECGRQARQEHFVAVPGHLHDKLIGSFCAEWHFKWEW